MAMLHEEELSELAGDISVYVLLAAMLLVFVADQACAVAHVVTKIWAQAVLVLLLLPLALVLFFRRAAGCSSKAADAESLSVKDVEERPYDFSLALMWLLLVAMLGTFSLVFYMYGYPYLADLFGHAVLVVVFLCEAFLYVRAALSLWKMNPTPNPKPSNMVAAE